MNITHITRNIPVKRLSGNRIIWDIIERLSSQGVNQNVLFPAEFIPNIPMMPERYKVFSELTGIEKHNRFDVCFYKYIRLPKKMSFFISDYCLNKEAVEGFITEAECLHAHYVLPDGLIAKRISIEKHIPYVLSVRQGDIDRLVKIKKGSAIDKKYFEVLHKSSCIISINPSIRDFLKNRYGINSILVPHGVDKSQISKEKISFNKVKIVTCGQFIKRKNIDWVIETVNKLLGSYDFEISVVGQGPLESKLKQSSSSKIKYYDWMEKEKLMDLFSKHNVFVLPSDNETFGMVYIEAAAKGLLVIGRKGTGLDGYLEQDKEAIFVDSKESLMQVIEQVLKGEIKCEEIALAGKKNIINNFLWDSITENYMNIYKKAIFDYKENNERCI